MKKIKSFNMSKYISNSSGQIRLKIDTLKLGSLLSFEIIKKLFLTTSFEVVSTKCLKFLG